MNDELKYLLAGKAVFTLYRAYHNERRTYKVTQDAKNPRRFFVRVLFGPDNTQDYRYVGLFYDDTLKLRVTKASVVAAESPIVSMFDDLLDKVAGRADWPSLEIYKSKRCARCGRLLTTPDSIQLGLGPECRNYV